MRRLIYFIFAIICFFCIYYIMNYFIWNFIYEGSAVGLIFAGGFAVLISTAITVKTKGTTRSFVVFFLVFAISILFILTSKRIGNKQAEYNIMKVKKAIDKYYIDHKTYPKKIVYLKDSGYIKNFSFPIFLISNGKYHYKVDKDSKGYELYLEAEYGDYGINVTDNNNTFNYHDY